MADLSELNSSGMTKVIGSDATGQETTPVASTPNGEMKTAISGTLDDTGTTAAVEDSTAPVRITPQRAVHTNLRNQAGTEVGTAAAPVRTDTTGTTTQPISAVALPLPAGAATEAKQDTQITSLQILDDVPTAQNGAFVKGNPVMGQLDDTGTTAATEDNVAVARITPQRALHTNLRNQAGTEIGTVANPVNTQDLADGPVTPGTVATKSMLGGGQYNSTPPTLTNGQQAALQMTANGSLKTTTDFAVVGGQLIPTMTNKFRVRYSTTPATAGSAYSTLYTRSGTGLFFGFQAAFNSANVRLRVTIDGGQIFEITLSDLKTFEFNDTTTGRMQMGGFWTTVGNTMDFSLKFAIPYASSVLIEMQRSDGTNHTLNQYMVFLTEDT